MSDSKNEYEAKFPLHHAVKVGDIEEVNRLLEEGGKVYANLKDLLNNTPLHYALQKQSEFNVDDNTALLIVSKLLNAGADIYLIKGYKDNTSLYNAALYRTAAIKILLEREANPFLINQYGATSAEIAGAGTGAKELLENAERKQRSTDKLISAICCGKTSSERLNKLTEEGGDVNGTTKSEGYPRKNDGENVLTHLIPLYIVLFAKSTDDNSRRSYLGKISKLISLGANPYKCDDHGNSAVSIISNLPEGYVKNKLEKAMMRGIALGEKNRKNSIKHSETLMDMNRPSSSGVKRKHGDYDQKVVELSSDEDEGVLPVALENYARQKLQEANQSSDNAPVHIVVAGESFTVTRIGERKSNSYKPGQSSTSQVKSVPSSSIGVSDVSQQFSNVSQQSTLRGAEK